MALLDMHNICRAAINLHKSTGFFRPEAVVFGSDDYCADIGASRTSVGEETLYARQRFVACCKAFGLQAIDSVFIDIKDPDGLKKQCMQGHAWGFTGKQVIHPSQVDIVQDCFTPSSEMVKWAKELIDGYLQHQKKGQGAFVFRGSMIDKPLLLQAQNIVKFLGD